MAIVIDKELVGYYVKTSHLPNMSIHSQITKKAEQTSISYLDAFIDLSLMKIASFDIFSKIASSSQFLQKSSFHKKKQAS